MLKRRPPSRAAKWFVRVAAGIALGLIVVLFLRGLAAPGTYRGWLIAVAGILLFVAWFESPNRDEFEDDLFGGDDDDPRGPHGFA